uniref:RRM domain-containing protein n=1 Tax=Zooxanthella nutricula TaxID=1333877 RepID=A0A7S2II10_9DINO
MLFSQYGDIVSVRQADTPPDCGIIFDFATCEAAAEAQSIVNLASLRGTTCRCLLVSALEEIRRTMVSGNRFIVENIDPAIEVHGLWDVCSLFGQVLDCKLQPMATDAPDGRPVSVAFVHYLREEEAAAAKNTLDKMQIGECEVRMRPFQWDDSNMFSGAMYARLMYNPYMDA